MNLSFLGWICTCLFAMCYVPQMVLTYRTKTVKDVSLGQWLIQLGGYLSGLGYGLWLKQAPLIFGYSWGATATIIYLLMYYHYRKNKGN